MTHLSPKLLDLFCGAGGCSFGYHRAGFAPYGVDNRPMPRYPFPFLQMDALEAMRMLLAGEGLTFSNGETLCLSDFAMIHASPPCQAYSKARKRTKEHPDLIQPVRELLIASSVPYVIENVEGAPLKANLMLCGTMFDLRVRRHRWFETTADISFAPFTCQCKGRTSKGELINYHNTVQRNRYLKTQSDSGSIAFKKALKVEWMNFDESQEAIPPAYTEYIGRFLMQAIEIHDSPLPRS